jgi:hypothetical protein
MGLGTLFHVRAELAALTDALDAGGGELTPDAEAAFARLVASSATSRAND